MKRLFSIVFLILGFAATYAQDGNSVIAYVMMGDILHYEDISIEFVEVLEDSRCPTTVSCIWAGEVKIALNVYSRTAKLIEEKEITFSASGVVNKTDHLLYGSKSIQILGLGVLPYPQTPDKIPAKDYQLELKIN